MQSTTYKSHYQLNPIQNKPIEDRWPDPRFGKTVRHYRIGARLTQEALGERCDLDRAYISSVERGKRNPSIVTVAKIAAALDVEVHLLFVWTDTGSDQYTNSTTQNGHFLS